MAQVRRQPQPAGVALRAAARALDGTQGKVGWFESARYEDGTPVALVAVVQEFGSVKKGIPPRSYMRKTQSEKGKEWANNSRQISQAVVRGQLPAGAVMEALTQKAEGDIRKTISKVLTPPLAEATIAARRRRHSKGMASTKPLVDSGVMLNTLTSQTSGTDTKK